MYHSPFHSDFAFTLFAFTFFIEKLLSQECVLGKQSKGSTPKYTVLKKNRLSALVNTYFYEHTSLCSWVIFLRSVSLLIPKVTFTYLDGLVCF